MEKNTAPRPETSPAIYLSAVPAGFPSPADNYLDSDLDLNERLIRHPAATFFVRVKGDSMTGAGIYSGDILVVDRALEPTDKNIVVAVLNGEFTVKRLRKGKTRVSLCPENPKYKTVDITPDMDFEVWGIVVHSIRSFI